MMKIVSALLLLAAGFAVADDGKLVNAQNLMQDSFCRRCQRSECVVLLLRYCCNLQYSYSE